MTGGSEPDWVDLSPYGTKLGVSFTLGSETGQLGVVAKPDDLRAMLAEAGFTPDPNWPRVMWRDVAMTGLKPEASEAVAQILAALPAAEPGSFSLTEHAQIYGNRGTLFAGGNHGMQQFAAETVRAIYETDDQQKLDEMLGLMREVAEAYELDFDAAVADAGGLTGPKM